MKNIKTFFISRKNDGSQNLGPLWFWNFPSIVIALNRKYCMILQMKTAPQLPDYVWLSIIEVKVLFHILKIGRKIDVLVDCNEIVSSYFFIVLGRCMFVILKHVTLVKKPLFDEVLFWPGHLSKILTLLNALKNVRSTQLSFWITAFVFAFIRNNVAIVRNNVAILFKLFNVVKV